MMQKRLSYFTQGSITRMSNMNVFGDLKIEHKTSRVCVTCRTQCILWSNIRHTYRHHRFIGVKVCVLLRLQSISSQYQIKRLAQCVNQMRKQRKFDYISSRPKNTWPRSEFCEFASFIPDRSSKITLPTSKYKIRALRTDAVTIRGKKTKRQ